MGAKVITLRSLKEVLYLLFFLFLGAMIFTHVYAQDIEIPLIKHAEQGNVEEVKKLIAKGADINARRQDGLTALMMASLKGHSNIVKLLIANRADVNAKDKLGYTALMGACKGGHPDTVKLLIASKADVNARQEAGGTALMIASLGGHIDIVKILIANNADVNAKMSMRDTTALILASVKGHADVAELLISNKADMNAKAIGGYTALTAAIKEGNTNIVRLLLEKKADVNVKTDDGKTPLMIAEERGSTDIVQLLKQTETKPTEASKPSKLLISELSADVVFTKDREKGSGKFYFKGTKYRMDTTGESQYVIIRKDPNSLWVINPEERSYLEMPYDQMQGPPWLALWGIEGTELGRKVLGSEMVGGHRAQKYEVTIKNDKETERVHEWIAVDTNHILKQEAVDGSWSIEYRNIRKSAPDNLFEVPAGFKKMSVPQMLQPSTSVKGEETKESAQTTDDKLSEVEGYRGIKWGANIKDLSGFSLAYPPVKRPEIRGLKIYRREGDQELNQMGDAMVEITFYSFYKDRFCSVVIPFRKANNFAALKELFSKQYGPGNQPHPSKEEYRWVLGDLTISLEFSTNRQTGMIVYYYNPIWKEVETEATVKGKSVKYEL